MKGSPTLRTVMTPFPYAIDVGAGIDAAASMMADHDVRHLPVIDGQRHLVGVVSQWDIQAAPREREEVLEIGDLCRTPAYTVDLDTPLRAVLLEMAEQHIGSALVTRRGKLVGILTATDVCMALADVLEHYALLRLPDDDGDAA